MNIPFPVSVPLASIPFQLQLAIAVASIIVIFGFARLSNWWVSRSVAKAKREQAEDEAKWPRYQGTLKVKRVRLPPDARPVPANLVWSYYPGGKLNLPPPPTDHPQATFHADVLLADGTSREVRLSREAFIAFSPGDAFPYAEGCYRNDSRARILQLHDFGNPPG